VRHVARWKVGDSRRHYETIELRGIARTDDMSHEGRQPKPGATTLASQPSTMSSAVTGKRSLTEALSPQIAETTNVPPVQKQTGDGVRDVGAFSMALDRRRISLLT